MKRTFRKHAAAALVAAVSASSVARAQTSSATSGSAVPPPPALEASKLSKLPKQKKFVEAEYPADARAKGIEADVILLLDLDDKGHVTSVGIAEPAKPAGMGFDEAAMLAAQGFEFEPAEVDGKPIAIQLSYKYKFRLGPAQPAATPPPAAPGAPPAAAAPARAPVANFVGVLRERGTRNPMSGVLVTVFRDEGGKPQGFEATSDASGTFRFFDLAPGEWKILIESPGYFPFRTTEEIQPGQATNVTYFVERGSYNPYDVLVTAPRPRKEVSRTVLSAGEIEKVPGTAGDPLAVIQNFAGVARPPLLSGFIIVRGSAPQDTRYFIDGAEIPLIYHFGGLRSVIPVGVLQSLDFYPGNFGTSFGRANGGIVDVQVKKLQPKRLGGYVDVSLLDSSVYLETPVGPKGSIALAGRRSYIDAILNATVPSDATVNLTTAPRYYDWQLIGNYRPTQTHDLRLFVIGSDDRLRLLFQNPADLSTQLTSNSFQSSTTFYRSILSDRWTPNESFENYFQVSQGRNWFDTSLGTLMFKLNFYTAQIRERIRQKLGEKLTFVAGADIQYQKLSGHVRLPKAPQEGDPPQGAPDLTNLIETELTGDNRWAPAGYVDLEWRPWERVLILPGFRVDHFPEVGETVPQPRATVRWGIGERLTLKGGAGLYAQAPQPWETDPNFGVTTLVTEKSLQLSAGAEYKLRPYLTFDATGYYKYLHDLVRRRDGMVVDTPNGPRDYTYDNGGVGRAYGLELVVRHELAHNLTGWLAYTLSRSERKIPGTDLYRLFDYDQTHILSVVASYALPRNWTVGARFRYTSGNPYAPIIGSVANFDTITYDPIYGAPNSARLGAFHQLDVRVDKRWIYQRWILNAYLDVQNIYNRSNPEALAYNYNFTKSKPQQGLPILPILGLRADF